jgi:hypothetical protein
MSMSATSGCLARADSTPLVPELASKTLCPAISSASRSVSLASALSSTMRIRRPSSERTGSVRFAAFSRTISIRGTSTANVLPVCGELLILGKSVIRHTQGEFRVFRSLLNIEGLPLVALTQPRGGRFRAISALIWPRFLCCDFAGPIRLPIADRSDRANRRLLPIREMTRGNAGNRSLHARNGANIPASRYGSRFLKRMEHAKLANGSRHKLPIGHRSPARKKSVRKKAESARPLRREMGSKPKSDKLVCRYCGSDDLAPSFIKRRDRRCRKCFGKRYGSAARAVKAKVKEK